MIGRWLRALGSLGVLAGLSALACSISAPDDPYFVGGARCTEGQKLCGAACASINAPEFGCAAESCAPCPSGQTACVDGQCAPPCPAGKTLCGGGGDAGACVDLASDPASCGKCGAACVLNHARAACSAGACAIASCDEGFADCNGLPGDGCEENLRVSLTACGGCKAACAAPSECSRGQCGGPLACHALRFTSPSGRIVFSNTGLDTGDGDFVVEMWLKSTGAWTAAEVFRFNDGPPISNGVHIGLDALGLSCALVGSGPSGTGTGSPILRVSAPPQGHWVHVACQRSAGHLTLFVDGKRAAEDVVSTPVIAAGTGGFGFAPDTSYAAPVLLGPVRISKVARYANDFTPSTQWPIDADTLASWLAKRPDRVAAPDELGAKRTLRFQGDIALELEDLPCAGQ